MMSLQTEKKENILFYCCGPTTYNDLHLGNLKTIYNSRVLFNLYKIHVKTNLNDRYNPIYCMNYTDIDDKIIKKSKEEFRSFFECSNFFLNKCNKTLKEFGLIEKEDVFFPRATNYISDIIEMIDLFFKFGLAYKQKDGLYFNLSCLYEVNFLKNLGITEKIPYYYLLDKNKNRKKVDYKKDNDFLLWKFNSLEPFWISPWGKGRPGWHIECSAIIKFFSDKYNINNYFISGGIDLVFPHHENQFLILDLYSKIKQKMNPSFSSNLISIFHYSSLLINKKKMSKELNNITYLSNIEKKDYNALKMLFLSNNISSNMEFSIKLLEENNKKINLLEKIFKINDDRKSTTRELLFSLLEKAKSKTSFYNIPLFISNLLSIDKDKASFIDKKTLYKFLNDIFFLEL